MGICRSYVLERKKVTITLRSFCRKVFLCVFNIMNIMHYECSSGFMQKASVCLILCCLFHLGCNQQAVKGGQLNPF